MIEIPSIALRAKTSKRVMTGLFMCKDFVRPGR